jgi:hypothetical protein
MVLGLIPTNHEGLMNGRPKNLDLFYKLRYFDHTNNGHGLIHLKTNIYGFEIAFFYMVFGPTTH